MSKILGTYHKDCIDGTTAAAVLLRKFPDAKLFPLAHHYVEGDITPILAEAKGAEVYTVDCGLGVREFLEKGLKVTTIDHHMGAKEEFESLAREHTNYTFVFNNDKSGASLSWATLFPEEAMPELIKYVEDADLWRHQFGQDTKDVNNYLSMFRNDPATVLRFFSVDFTELKAKGKILSTYVDKEVENLLKTPSIILKIGDSEVPAFNITSYVAINGNLLSEKLGKTVVLFTILGENVKFHFRSKDGQSPTSLELAKILGGGGHEHASGAVVPLKTFLGMIQ